MPYKVEIKRSAKKELAHLPGKRRRQVCDKIEQLSGNPRHRGCIKLTNRGGECRVVVGGYRVLYEIDDSQKTVHIGAIRARKDAYRRR